MNESREIMIFVEPPSAAGTANRRPANIADDGARRRKTDWRYRASCSQRRHGVSI
jgi:hypothetical protein